MTRAFTDYSAPTAHGSTGGGGIDVTVPVAGHYRHKLASNTVIGGVRIWHGPPRDPETGEEMDRHWRWQAEFNGEPIDFDQVWPVCAGEPIAPEEYQRLIRRQEWARQHAPDSAYAEPGRKIDLLSPDAPLPF